MLVKTIGLVLFVAHLVGCNSAMIGYLVGTASHVTGDIVIRQLQPYIESDESKKEK
jgi:hypothetical protein|tara:strand:- start:550 stop:717 length:168 start_codon:yes stop_codon:yes gene_type:complete